MAAESTAGAHPGSPVSVGGGRRSPHSSLAAGLSPPHGTLAGEPGDTRSSLAGGLWAGAAVPSSQAGAAVQALTRAGSEGPIERLAGARGGETAASTAAARGEARPVEVQREVAGDAGMILGVPEGPAQPETGMSTSAARSSVCEAEAQAEDDLEATGGRDLEETIGAAERSLEGTRQERPRSPSRIASRSGGTAGASGAPLESDTARGELQRATQQARPGAPSRAPPRAGSPVSEAARKAADEELLRGTQQALPRTSVRSASPASEAAREEARELAREELLRVLEEDAEAGRCAVAAGQASNTAADITHAARRRSALMLNPRPQLMPLMRC